WPSWPTSSTERTSKPSRRDGAFVGVSPIRPCAARSDRRQEPIGPREGGRGDGPSRAMAGCAAMEDVERQRSSAQPRSRRVLTPRRVAAVLALALLAISFRRHLRVLRDVYRHRRRLKLAFTLLVLLRQLRKS